MSVRQESRRGWLVRLVLTTGGTSALAVSCLALGLSERDGWAVWVSGVFVGSAIALSLLTGWPPQVSRIRSSIEARVFSAAGIIVMVVIYLAYIAGGRVSVFALAPSGAFLGVFAIWLTVYTLRHRPLVRARLGGRRRGARDVESE